MLFLEDSNAQKRPTVPDWRLQQHRQHQYHHSRLSEVSTVPPQTKDHHEKTASSVKRSSIFSRRRSTAINSSTDSHIRSSSVAGASRRSSLADMTATEHESFRNKFFQGFASVRKVGGRKSDPLDHSSEHEGDALRAHLRAMSEANDQQQQQPISKISSPYEFQHVTHIKRSSRPIDAEAAFTQISMPSSSLSPIISPPKELQSSLARRTNKRPPPLRPKRPEESCIPQELLSPQNGTVPSIRHMRSADAFAAPLSAPLTHYLMPIDLSPVFGPAPIPPRRSSKRRPPNLANGTALVPTQSAPQTFFRDSFSQDDFDQYPAYLDPNLSMSRRDPPKQSIHPPPDPLSYHRTQPSPLFNAPLEQVLEEPEGPESSRLSKDIKNQLSLRHAKSSPNMSRSSSKTVLPRITDDPPPRFAELPPITFERPVSQGSDTLGDLTRRSFSTGRDSGGFIERSATRTTAGSWEEDIEFCYDHSAEAHCEFDWNNVSKFLDSSEDGSVFGNPHRSSGFGTADQRISLQSQRSQTIDMRDKSFLHQSIIPSFDSLPDLDYRSAHSGSTNSLAIGTPQDKRRMPSSEALRQSTITSQLKAESLLGIQIPQSPPTLDTKMNLDSDQLYEDFMSTYVERESKHQQNKSLPILEPKVYSRENSPTISQKGFARSKIPASPPGPTSAPMQTNPDLSDNLVSSAIRTSTNSSITPLAISLDKDLPPLPASSPVKPPPLSLTMESMVAQLRSPTESPTIEHSPSLGVYTPPASNHSSPPMPEFKPQRSFERRKMLGSENLIFGNAPSLLPRLSPRKADGDAALQRLAGLPSPPESPGIPQLQLSVSHNRVQSSSSTSKELPATPSLLKKRPSMPILRSQQPQKRVEFKENLADSPIMRSPSGSEVSYSNYSLFPGSGIPRPMRPRRSTAS